ncbi:1888_t:CDS:2, partial [Gigaspora margarita]
MNFSIHFDDNNIIRLPFGRAVEQYLYSLPISHGTRYKVQSRKRVNDTIKLGFITVKRMKSSVDYLCWKTKKEQNKSTNRLDDSLRLTKSRKHLVQQIHAGEKIDFQVWHWVWFCSGEGDCQRNCGGIGKCIEICDYFVDEKNLNPLDMHKCSIRIITKVILSEVDTDYPVCLIIEGNYVPQNVIQKITILSQINLSQEARDLVITSRRADKCTAKEIKMKLLLPYNDNSRTQSQVGPWTTVHELVNSMLKEKCVVLYYQQADLEQARDFGSFCLGIDGKYDLNSNRALVLSLVVKDNAGYVGRSRDKEEALKLGKAYQSFIKSLPLTEIAKESLCNDIFANWLSEEWINSFIDGSRMLSADDRPGIKPMTMNNLTERMNKSIEVQNNIIKEASSQLIFEA